MQIVSAISLLPEKLKKGTRKDFSTLWYITHGFTQRCREIRGAGFENLFFLAQQYSLQPFMLFSVKSYLENEFLDLLKLCFDFVLDFGH